jgi:outer membrane protein
MLRLRVVTLVLGGLICLPGMAVAQPTGPARSPSHVLTLDQAIQYAVDHYPTVRAAVEQVNVATAGVSVARAAYLPRLDSVWQSNRATTNNISGQVLPQSVFPAMSGPVLPSTSGQSVWGSVTGALFSWEPLDFGLRDATVRQTAATVTRARTAEALTRLDVQGAVGAAFLGILAAQRAVTAMQADFARRDVLARTVRTLVDNQLRPGADASRADAERAAAHTRVIQAQAAETLAQTTMTRVLGLTTGTIVIDATDLLDQPPALALPEAAATTHPLAQFQHAAVDVARAQEQVLARTDLPRVYLQSSVLARGSGANPNGDLNGGVGGLGLDRANWAAGVQVVFPNLFDFTSLRARKAAAAAAGRAEIARYDEAVLTITSQQQATAAMVQAARAVALNTPVQLAAAQQSEAQARARYQAGLASILEVADADSLLAQAEVQDQLARVDVWRALLAEAVAQGTLAPFLTRLRP